jgi:hypothetical protein
MTPACPHSAPRAPAVTGMAACGGVRPLTGQGLGVGGDLLLIVAVHGIKCHGRSGAGAAAARAEPRPLERGRNPLER